MKSRSLGSINDCDWNIMRDSSTSLDPKKSIWDSLSARTPRGLSGGQAIYTW